MRMIHWLCQKCGTTVSEPMVSLPGFTKKAMLDAYVNATCDECERKRIERIKASGWRPSIAICDRMIRECERLKPAGAI